MSKPSQGFSLIEVLLSLFLMSTVALFLMQQMMTASLFYTHMQSSQQAIVVQDNRTEALYRGCP